MPYPMSYELYRKPEFYALMKTLARPHCVISPVGR